MFNDEYKTNYAANLKNFIQRWRDDSNTPALPFYIGELSCKTVWGMDNRNNMYAISEAQKEVCDEESIHEEACCQAKGQQEEARSDENCLAEKDH